MRALVCVVVILTLCAGVALALEPDSRDIVDGIDVSVFQGDIDFERVKSDGIRVVYIRAGIGAEEDARFREYSRNARSAGLNIGYYFFVTARDSGEAREQADFFYRLIRDEKYECRPVMDFESFKGESRRDINDIGRAFMERLKERTGVTPMLYTDAYAADRVWNRRMGDYPLWVADWGVYEPTVLSGHWPDGWTGFQYTDKGRVPGISGDVDRDRFTKNAYIDEKDGDNVNGYIEHTITRGETLTSIARRYGTTVAELVALNDIANPNLIYAGETIRVPASTGTRSYTIRRGDTLSGLARQYGTTVNELANLNNISNPNLIYAGDTIRVPNGGGTRYVVQRGDTLWAIARRYGTTVNRLASYNGITNPSRLSIGQVINIP